MKKKSFVAGMLTMALLFSLVVTAYAAYQKQATLNYSDIKITLNGLPIIPKNANGEIVEPFSIDGTTYLPIRAIGNALGLGVTWDQKQNTIVLESQESENSSEDDQIPNKFYDGYVIPAFENIDGVESYTKQTVLNDETGVAYYYEVEGNNDLIDTYEVLLKQYGFLSEEMAGLSRRYTHPVSKITVSVDTYGKDKFLMVVLKVPQKIVEVVVPDSSDISDNDNSSISSGSSNTNKPSNNSPADDRAERYAAYKQEYDLVNNDYSRKMSNLKSEKQKYRDREFQNMAKVGNTYQAGIDADKLANKYYDPEIKALEEEWKEALRQLELKYGL